MVLLSSISANLISIAQHTGSNNPITEGWQMYQTGGSNYGAVLNDYGYNAWLINDSSAENYNINGNGGIMAYDYNISDAIIAQGNQHGWKLSARIRLTSNGDSVDDSVNFCYRDGTTDWRIRFGTQSDGDPIVQTSGPDSYTGNTGPIYALENGRNQYHLYELVFDPTSHTADLFVDGIEVLSNYAGSLPDTRKYVRWGANDESGIGYANYAYLNFSVQVPETGTWISSLFGLSMLYLLRRKSL